MRLLLILLLLPTFLLASKIVKYDVKTYNDHVDIFFTFDAPYKGTLRKNQGTKSGTQNDKVSEEIIIKIGESSFASPEVKKVSSPFLSKLTIIPLEKETKVIVNTAKKVTMHSAKSSDSLHLRLRFIKPDATLPKTVQKPAKKPLPQVSEKRAEQPFPQSSLSGKGWNTVIFLVIVVLIIAIPSALWHFRKRLKSNIPTLLNLGSSEVEKAKPSHAAGRFFEKWPKFKGLRLFRSKQSNSSTEKGGSAAPKYIQALNPKNKMLTLVITVIMIALLVPKVNLYYQAEHLAEPYGVVLSNEEVSDEWLWLSLKDATLFYQRGESARIDNIDVMLFVLYNSIRVEKIRISSVFEQFVPLEIAHVTVRYSVLNPLEVTIEAIGDFGELSGRFLLTDQSFKVTIEPSILMKKRFGSTLNNLQKDEAGGYYYESRF